MTPAGEDWFTIAVATPVGMASVSRHRRQNETSPVAIPGALSGQEATAFTRSNPAAPLDGTVLGIHFPKGKWPRTFRNRPSPPSARQYGIPARFLPSVLSSKGRKSSQKGTDPNPCTRVSHRIRPWPGPRMGDLVAECRMIVATIRRLQVPDREHHA